MVCGVAVIVGSVWMFVIRNAAVTVSPHALACAPTHSPFVVLDILIELSLEFGLEREDVIHAELIHIRLQRRQAHMHRERVRRTTCVRQSPVYTRKTFFTCVRGEHSAFVHGNRQMERARFPSISVSLSLSLSVCVCLAGMSLFPRVRECSLQLHVSECDRS